MLISNGHKTSLASNIGNERYLAGNPAVSSASYVCAINKVENISTLSADDLSQPPCDEYCDEETPEAAQKVDRLLDCAIELKKNLDCLLTGNSQKYIALGGQSESVPTKRITLPSGKIIYAGFLQNKLLVSDGEYHYLDKAVTQPPMGFWDSLICLVDHLNQVCNDYAAILPPGRVGTAPSMDTHRHFSPVNHHVASSRIQPLSTLWHNAQLFGSKVSGWLAGLSDPLSFPQTLAQEVNHSPNENLYSAHAEFVVKIGAGESQPQPPPVDHEKPTVTGNNDKPGAAADEPRLNSPPRSVSVMKYSIEHIDRKITIANNEAKAFIQSLEEKYFLANSDMTESLDILLTFDKFIGKEIVEIFHRGLYLKNNSRAFDLIICKQQLESIIDYYRLAHLSSTSLVKINNYIKGQIKISDYLTHTYRILAEALILVDYDIISETVKSSNHLSLQTVKDNLIEKIRKETTPKKIHLKKLLKSTILMQQAYEKYCLHLTFDGDHTIDRVIYLNSKEIYQSIVYDNRAALIDQLFELRYYLIFEYNRINDISVHSRYLILPEQQNKYSSLLDENEQELTYEYMDKLSTKEILSFINQEDNAYPHLDYLLKIIEFTRQNETPNESAMSWQERSIFSMQKTYQTLSHLIKTGKIEKLKALDDNEWYSDYRNIINKTKKSLIMLIYIQELQQLFNDSLMYFINNHLYIQGTTEIQTIMNAKIAAMKSYSQYDEIKSQDHFLLQKYEQEILEENLEILVRSAAFWFMSQKRKEIDDTTTNQLSVYVINKFITIQNLFLYDLKSRFQESFTSVYKLSTSDEKESLEDYYQQFIEYKLHDSFSEAQYLTIRSLFKKNLHSMDLFYPPKNIYTFKIYSRNYVHNTLTPGNSFYSPADNIGYISIIKLKSGKLILASTLLSFSFIKDITALQHHNFISRIINGWQNNDFSQTIERRSHISANEHDLQILFSADNKNHAGFSEILGIILKKPEDELAHTQAPAYTLAALEQKDIMAIITPYIVHTKEMQLINGATLPLITTLDYLNQATLLTISDRLKTTLRNYTWLEYIAHLIPFFQVICHHWHDSEYKYSFHEVIFDLFDLTMMLISIGAGIRKITDLTFKNIINKAIEQKVPPALIKQFIINELISVLPEVGLKSAKITTSNLLSFFNPLTSLPLTSSVFDKFRTRIFDSVQQRISFSNDITRKKIDQKLALRKEWRAEVDETVLTRLADDIFIDNSNPTVHYYIKDETDFFEVVKHPGQLNWHVINNQILGDNKPGIGVKKTTAGKWVNLDYLQSDRRHSSVSFYDLNQEKISGLDTIQFESIPTFNHVAEDLDETTVLNKQTLRFFLYQNTFVRELIRGKAKHEDFLDQFYGTFFFRKEIVDLMQIKPHSGDAQLAIKAMAEINGRNDGIVRFRAIISWRNENDLRPKIHFALRIDINDKIYVIDLYEMRAHLKTHYNKDVFTQSEWLINYGIDTSSEYELIKYKDFELITDAKTFQFREALSPIYYIQDGFLLKEPFWYRSLLVSGLPFTRQPGHTPATPRFSGNLIGAMRSLRFNRNITLSMEEYPLKLLMRWGELSEEDMAKALKLINEALRYAGKASEIFSVKRQITSLDDLLKVNAGKLLAFIGPSERLEHLLLSLGQGRFTGFGNSFFDPGLPDRVSLIIAEHLGKFTAGKLELWYTGYKLTVFAGTTVGMSDEIDVLAEDVLRTGPRPYLPTFLAGQTHAQPITREQMLLGDNCRISLIRETQKTLDISLTGAPFMVNGLDPVEFADVLRGLPYLGNLQFDLDYLDIIILRTCYGGYGDHYSMAQILADHFNIPVHLYPLLNEPEIKERRPEWFQIYQPLKNSLNPAERAAIHAIDNPQRKQAQQNHRQLHDLMLVVHSVVDPQALLHQKRIYQYIPPIYIDIANILMSKEKYAPRNIKQFDLSPTSLALFYQIYSEYCLTDLDSPHIKEQAFLDIILSIDELKYLSNWFNSPHQFGVYEDVSND
jgi:hypothetical protein